MRHTGLAVVLGFALGLGCGGTEPGQSEPSQTEGSSGEVEASSESGEQNGSSSSGGVEGESCCGCLCGDPLWSCSQETCIDGNGEVLELGPEAGFLETGGEAFELGMPPQRYNSSSSRVWYAFRPAQTQPEDRPLLVFFNGGPGTATTSGLFAMHTGPKAVDTEASPPGVVDNPYDWSAFANLLYLDMPGTGLSQPGDTSGDGPWHPEGEAATTLRVVLGFLQRHPQLRGDVVPVGESFGGRRAMLMARLVGDTAALRAGFADSGFRDEALADQLDAFDRERFGRYIMVQGAIPTIDQRIDEPFDCPRDEPICDPVVDDMHRRFTTTTDVLRSIDALSEALGVDASGIEGLDLSSFEHYRQPPIGSETWMFGELSVRTFATIVRNTEWFATDAALDGLVRMHHLAQILDEDYPDLVASASIDSDGEGPRPGTLRIDYTDGETRTIRLPHYPRAGHAVSAYQPEELRDDVEAWLAATSDG